MRREKVFTFVVGLLFFICFVELFYKLGEIPNGIHVDEAGSMYDALNISKYGVDRYLYKYPVYFINYGGGQSALYTYLGAVSMSIFGKSLWSFRLVAVLTSLVSYYFFYKMISKYDSKLKGAFALLLLTILPFYIMKSRWGLDCYLLNPFLIISLYFFISAIEKSSNLYYFISGILFGITLYTYAISYLILPLFLFFMIIYLFINKKIDLKNISYLMVPIIVLGIPLFLMILINKEIIAEEFVTNFISIPKLWQYRENEISIFNLKAILYDLYIILWGDLIDYNTIDQFGTMYFISIVFIFIGLYLMIIKFKNKITSLLDVVMFILFFVVLSIAFFTYGISVNRINVIYIPFVYLIASSLEWLYVKKNKVILGGVFIIYCFIYILFINFYFNDYSVTNLFAGKDYFEAFEYTKSIYHNGDYSGICIHTNKEQDYIFTLLDDGVNPFSFNENLVLKTGIRVLSYDHYIFECNTLRDDYVYFVSNDSKFFHDIGNNYNIYKISNYSIIYAK